ncbi:hypothetical protein [Eisenbergiella porci]|uniref:hypothetical protein n=1 Tax=Eisenbergiella porci TaxID=2652274 RepID=UPI00204D16E4|nr:hypothetical protein [Eisenbergiella porci]DAN95578.1 MAG TPA: hypothetical protein [Caudoviricetes sp.]
MTLGTAYWIFRYIENTVYSDTEKIEAIKIISELDAHNAIKKEKMAEVIKWLLGKVTEDLEEGAV